jgi:hypothetical protein
MTEYDNIVVAAQEHAAKHAALCILLRTEKWQMLYRQSVWLYALYKSYISQFTLQV